jgi:hypothetical protein
MRKWKRKATFGENDDTLYSVFNQYLRKFLSALLKRYVSARSFNQ